MPSARLPFGNLQSSGMDEIGGASPVSMNVIAEPNGTVRRRPGLVPLAAAPDAGGCNGIFEVTNGTIYAVGATTAPQRNIYRLSGTSSVALTGVQSDLRGSARPIFAETESILAISAGQDVQKVVLATNVSSRLANVPTAAVSHVVGNSSSLLVNDLLTQKNTVYFSNIALGSSYAGFEDWSTQYVTGSFQAEARPDGIIALLEHSNEIWAVGSTSLQTFAPDQRGWSPSSTKEIGCLAPYSVVRSDSNCAWLDHLRRFQMSDGRTNSVISDPIQRTLDEMGTVSDCFGYRVVLGPMDVMVWTFPTDGRTFTFQKGAGWGQWSTAGGNFAGLSKCDSRVYSAPLLTTTGGLITKLAFGTTTDVGAPIDAYVTTGFQDHETDARKTCKSVRLALRRGQGDGSAYVLLSWRDSLGAWEDPIEVELGSTGESDPVVVLYSLGVYRRRQWKIEFNGTADLVLVAATEDFDVEGN